MISISKFWRLNCDEIGCHGMEDTQQKKQRSWTALRTEIVHGSWQHAILVKKKTAGKWDIMGIHWEHHLMYKCITV